MTASSNNNPTNITEATTSANSELLYLTHDLLSRSNIYHYIWSVITADNFTPVKRDESFSAMLIELYRLSASSLVMK